MATNDMTSDLAAERERLLDAWERESATTLKVLRAYPKEESELKPHDKCKCARELAWMFTLEQALAARALEGELQMGDGFPPAPDSMDEVIERFEQSRRDLLAALRGATDEQMGGTTRFFTGPQQMGDWPNPDFLRFLLHDQIHHRGQFSVYLRMADGKVPSIYGPSADEPWF